MGGQVPTISWREEYQKRLRQRLKREIWLIYTRGQGVKRIITIILVIMLGATTACSSALSYSDKTSDNAHAFMIHGSQIIDKINEDIAPEGEAFLVIKYEIENLQNRNDSVRQWTDQIILESDGDYYDFTFIKSLDNQLWETSLLKNETKAGYIAFTVPEDIHDFKATFTFPTSETEAVYRFRPADKRISVNTDYVLTRLEQIERTKRIPLLGGLLAAFSNSPIRYLGVILVPEEEIPQLMEQTKGLTENAKRQVIEDYLIAHKHCRLE